MSVTRLNAETIVRHACVMFADRGYRDVRDVFDATATFTEAQPAPATAEPEEAGSSDESGADEAEAEDAEVDEDEEEEEDDEEPEAEPETEAEAEAGEDTEAEDDEWVEALEEGTGSDTEALDRHMAVTALRPDGSRVALFLLVNATLKLGIHTVEALVAVAEQRRLGHVVLVSDGKWTHPARMQLAHTAPFTFEHFDCLSLSILVPRHALVPPHRALDAEEAAAVNARYRCAWGKINPDTDPVARYFAWPEGTLVELTFASRTNGLATEYRQVARGVRK